MPRMNSSELLCYYNPALIPADERTLDVDLCVYGGNAAGCVTTIQARQMGLSVVLLESGRHVGGLTAGGLSYTDFGNKHVIGGLSREFYRRCGAHYGVDEEWHFEPKVAEGVLLSWLAEVGVEPLFRRFLSKVHKEGNRITSIELEGGLKVRAKIFVDCSHEGDLMAQAGVSYHVGREDNAVYGETLNGQQERAIHQFDFPVSPYVVENDASSGLLPGIETSEYVQGAGDARVQAYCFRLCLSKNPANQIPFEKPADYDEREYELLARCLKNGWENHMNKYDEIRGEKCDMNNYGAVSSDFIGRNHDYPEGDYAVRERVFQEHVTYQKGLMWFRSNDVRVPQNIQENWRRWALPADEFPDCGGWPHQLYIRESRRMISDYVVTEADCRGERECDDAVGMGSYTLDSHKLPPLCGVGKWRGHRAATKATCKRRRRRIKFRAARLHRANRNAKTCWWCTVRRLRTSRMARCEWSRCLCSWAKAPPRLPRSRFRLGVLPARCKMFRMMNCARFWNAMGRF